MSIRLSSLDEKSATRSRTRAYAFWGESCVCGRSPASRRTATKRRSSPRGAIFPPWKLRFACLSAGGSPDSESGFKYLREEYALDALVDYAVLPDNPVREVPNPAWAAVDAKLREARAELTRLQAEYGRKALGNLERVRATMRGFKIAQGKLGQTIRAAMKRVATLETKRAVVPKRLPVQEVVCDEVVKLAPERKHLTSLLKMVAYQAESDLVRLVAPHYRRVEEEGRTLIQSALSSDADLEVTDRELRVTVTPLSSAHRTRAIATLCHELNCSEIVFPGSRLRLHYCVKETS